MKSLLFVFLILCSLFCSSFASVQCLDPSGKPVDWWVMIKAPYLPDSSDPAAASGYGFAYADKNSPSLQYTGLRLDTDTNGALANTLNQIFHGNTANVGWLMYNDETPDDSTHSSYGHTKGDCAFDSTSGFWLVHSVPRWPNAPPTSYAFPDYEKTYGQSFLCMTFPTSTFNTIGAQFLLNKPYVYSSNMNSNLNQTLPNIVKVLNHQWITPANSSTINIVSSGGVQLRTFAKNSNWNSSLYEYLVAPGITSGLLVETWQNGSGGKMPSFCTPEYPYDAMNVLAFQLTSAVSWPETKDHSKWAVSWDIPNWVCIGDINRMYSQNTRGGGTYCFQNPTLYNSFRSGITNADYC